MPAQQNILSLGVTAISMETFLYPVHTIRGQNLIYSYVRLQSLDFLC